MLKLRSMARPSASGMVPAANVVTDCATPSSSTVNASRGRPVTGLPDESDTET